MIIPSKLNKGDTVKIVSTARKVSENEIQFATEWLKRLGFRVKLGKTIGLEHHQFAGTDQQRTKDFQEAIDSPEINAIWCARGGYGTIRIIDLLDFSKFKKNPKWIIGYSDITVLHSHLHNLNIATIHAPMAFDIGDASAEARQSLQNLLSGKSNTYNFKSDPLNKTGNAEGVAIGGNLSVLYSMCGSKSAIDTTGKILFLEDLDEYLYHIDRMFQNLDRNGILKDLAALVIGGMTKMHDNSTPFGYSVYEILLNSTKSNNYPVIFNAPFGHITDNRSVILGKKISLKADINNVTLEQ